MVSFRLSPGIFHLITTLILSSCTSFDTKHLSNEGTLPATEATPIPSPFVQNWLEYQNVNFTIKYPRSWSSDERFDYNPQNPTKLWTFRNEALEDKGISTRVSVGVRATKIEPDETLMQWSIRQALHSQATAQFDDLEISVKGEGEVGGLEAVFAAGRSPMTEFRYTNVQCGDTVWFIWTNIGKSRSAEMQRVYDHMVESFTLDCEK